MGLGHPLPHLGWTHEPFLLVNEDFDWWGDTNEGNVSTFVQKMFAESGSAAGPAAWRVQAIANNGGQLFSAINYHKGVHRLTTSATNGSGVTCGIVITTDLVTPGALLVAERAVRTDIWLRLQSLTDAQAYFGLLNTIVSVTRGAYFIFTSSSSANWFCRCENANVVTAVDTGQVATTNWVKLTIVNRIDAWEFYINDVVQATIATNMPVGDVTLGGGIFNLAAGAKAFEIDHWMLWTDGSQMVD